MEEKRTVNEYAICKARLEDLQEILLLQHLAYQSEAVLLDNYDIQPLKQTLDEVIAEYHKGMELKDFVDKADKRLYYGKNHGKNVVINRDVEAG
jgi:hypothetical protein